MLTSVTRFVGGVGNVTGDQPLIDLRKPFEGLYVTFFDDFLPYTAANYVVTGAGSAAAVVNADGGRINLISSAGGEQSIQSVAYPFTLAAGQDLFYQARFMIDDANLSGFAMGFGAADTTPYATAPTDGVVLRKTAGAVGVTATLYAASVAVASGVISNPLVAGTMYHAGIAFTPQDSALRVTINGIGAVRLLPAAPLPTVPMAPFVSSFGAAARTLQLDYLYMAKGR